MTGANGFIGAHLVSALALAGADVIAVVRAATDLWRLHSVAPDVPVWRADVRTLDEPENVRHFGAVDVVFHLAGAGILPGMYSAREMIDHNVAGTLATLRFAERVRARRVVCSGSCYEYGNASRAAESWLPRPLSEYGATKAAATVVAQSVGRTSATEVVVLRPFAVYGPLEDTRRLVPHVLARALAGLDVVLSGGGQLRDWVYVDDAVEAFARAAVAEGINGEIFNVCTGIETSVREVAEQVADLAGSATTLRFEPDSDRAPGHRSLTGDPRHAAERLGFAARTTLADGLARTLAHMPLSIAPERRIAEAVR